MSIAAFNPSAFNNAGFNTGNGAGVLKYIALLTSMSAGHSHGNTGYPPSTAITASPNVRAGGVPVLRHGDNWTPHGGPVTVVATSSKVRVNGVPIARIGDKLSCGDSIVSGGSSKVRSV